MPDHSSTTSVVVFFAAVLGYWATCLLIVWPRLVRFEPWRPFLEGVPAQATRFYYRLMLNVLIAMLLVALILGVWVVVRDA
jgi:hypothetical protein